MVNFQQIRAARGWLGWSQQELADRSRVAKRTIVRLETGDWSSQPSARTLADLQRAFEDAGIRFIFDETGGAGLTGKVVPPVVAADADGAGEA